MVALLGVDVGTSAAKALVVDAEGRVRAQARTGYEVRTPRPGWAESDPAEWWAAVVAAVRKAVASAGEPPRAVGLSGQMHGVVVVDVHGRPLRPALLWPDTRATGEVAAYRALDPRLQARLANPLVPGMAGPLLRWLTVHEPGVSTRARWALQPKDWVRLELCGQVAAEPSDASATLLYDVAGDRWDAEVAGAVGVDPALLAPLVASAAVAGPLRADAAASLGLRPGTPVAAGAADTAAGALGAGLVRPGALQLTLGTGGQLVMLRETPVASPDTGTHLYRSAAPAGWYAMAATLNAGLALDWVRRLLAVDWPVVYAAAAATPSANDPLFLPYLVGERTPHLDPELRGAWVGLGGGHDRGDLLRAALEGVAFALRDAFDALPGAGAARFVRLAGGGSVEPAWRQLLADVLDRPLHAVDVPAASARGAALLAGLATGVVDVGDVGGALAPATRLVAEPRPAATAARAERLARFRAAVARAREQGR